MFPAVSTARPWGEMNCSGGQAESTPFRDEVTAWRQLLDSVVPAIRDIDIAAGIERNLVCAVELQRTGTELSQLGRKRSIAREYLDPNSVVAYENIPARRDGYSDWSSELPVSRP